MSETTPEQPAHPWLPVEATHSWLQLDPTSPLASVAEWCRQASAAYCEDQRRDLFAVVDQVEVDGVLLQVREFAATANTVMAGLIGTARLYARRSSPAGLASFGEFGASEVLRLDPDVARLLGTGRYATPVVG